MATTYPHDQSFLPAARLWAERCLVEDGSIFQPGKELWSPTVLAEFQQNFVENLLEDSRGFFTKLEVQLKGGSPQLCHLGAEMLWLLHLAPTNIKPQTKIDQITQIWEWSEEPLPKPEEVKTAYSDGFANTGTAYSTLRAFELHYLHELTRRVKELPIAERRSLIDSPWAFAEFLDAIQHLGHRQLRHVLLHLLFPKSFERIANATHRTKILEAFSSHLPDPLPDPPQQLGDIAQRDWKLYQLRKSLEQEHPADKLDYYLPPLDDQWTKSRKKAGGTSSVVKEDLKKYGTGKKREPRHWVISPGEQARLWEEFQAENIAAIGWDDLGDLLEYKDREAFREALALETESDSGFKNNTLALWEFAHEIKLGDIVYAKQGRERVLGKGVVTEEYQFLETRDEYLHVIGVNWQDVRPTELVDGTRVPMKTLTNIDNYRRCRELLESFYDGNIIKPLATYTREEALRDLFMSEKQFDQITSRLRQKKNIILEGPPGVGKTFVARRLAYYLMGEKNNNRARMVQFHQSYSYEDFIQGFRPTSTGGFEIQDGIFYDLCTEAMEDSDRDYFLVIDEINRGNLSKIFGELMMLIEHDKRGENFAIQLAYSKGPEKTFHVPANVHLIGTMNTADRSLSMVDYALRRRFSFFTLEPGFDSANFRELLEQRKCSPELRDHLISKLNALNEAILADARDLGRGYRIGHSFFCPGPDQEATPEWLEEVIEFEIGPLLREYWVDRPEQAEEEIQKLRFQ